MPETTGSVTLSNKTDAVEVMRQLLSDQEDLEPLLVGFEEKKARIEALFSRAQLYRSFFLGQIGVIRPVFSSVDESQGELLLNGRWLKRSAYPFLYSGAPHSIGEAVDKEYGPRTLDSAPAFWLPDLRGRVLRGLDSSGTIDPDGNSRKLSDTQNDGLESHTHVVPSYDHIRSAHWSVTYRLASGSNYPVLVSGKSVSAQEGGLSETRMKNVSVNYVIRASWPGIDLTSNEGE